MYRPFCTCESCPIVSGSTNFDLTSVSNCCAVRRVYHVLQNVFGYTEFRAGQLKAAVAALHGHDVFVQMCTGGGKTLCMFLPPLSVSTTSVGVVISPLNSIMDEQVYIVNVLSV